MGINLVSLSGRLTKDVELRFTPSGVANAKVTIAVQRDFKNGQGERESDFIQLVLWKKTAEFAANNLSKGNRVNVTGRIQTGSYEGQNGRVFTTDVVVDKIDPIDWANSDNGQQQNNGQPSFGGGQPQQQQQQFATNNMQQQFGGQSQVNEDPFANNKGPEVDDSDLPF